MSALGRAYARVREIHGNIQRRQRLLAGVRYAPPHHRFCCGYRQLRPFREIHFGRLKPVADGTLGAVHDIGWPVLLPGIDMNAVAHLAAEQLMHGAPWVPLISHKA